MRELQLSDFKYSDSVPEPKQVVFMFSIDSWLFDLTDDERSAIERGYGDLELLLRNMCNTMVYMSDTHPTETTQGLRLYVLQELLENIMAVELELHTHYSKVGGDTELLIERDIRLITSGVHKFIDTALDLLLDPIRYQVTRQKELASSVFEFNLVTLTPEQKMIQLTYF